MAQQPLEIILLRQWASHMAMPIWIAAENGDLLYYNEAAEPLLGRRFDEAGAMPASELSKLFETRTAAGEPIAAHDLPISVALRQRRPEHGRIMIRALDGAWRIIAITAFPVDGEEGLRLGAVAIFWEVESP